MKKIESYVQYGLIVWPTAGLVAFLIYFFLPGELRKITNSDEIMEMVAHPDDTFNVFNQCKNLVADVDRCYAAYSAAVQIADAKNCSPSSLALKRKFKRLVEHSTNGAIEDEIRKDCPAGQ
ncbi:TPA: hypothetical protein N3Z43_005291 [Klebsiella pneumoniae]|nr:hypothetical protein [Klebsiella pneumoniae]